MVDGLGVPLVSDVDELMGELPQPARRRIVDIKNPWMTNWMTGGLILKETIGSAMKRRKENDGYVMWRLFCQKSSCGAMRLS